MFSYVVGRRWDAECVGIGDSALGYASRMLHVTSHGACRLFFAVAFGWGFGKGGLHNVACHMTWNIFHSCVQLRSYELWA